MSALPKVADIMADELGWSKQVKEQQVAAATTYLEAYGGRVPDKKGSILRDATYRDVNDIFNAIDADGNGSLDIKEIADVAAALGFPMKDDELKKAFKQMDKNDNGRVTLDEFIDYWNHDTDSVYRTKLANELGVGGKAPADINDIGTGTMLG